MNQIISIIVPIYNVEKYLTRCIKKLVDQTYPNIEIILVDDGSTDKSGIICDEWKEKDKRIKVVHKINGGLSDARNVGIQCSSGEYILLVDSDDYIAESTCEELLNIAIETSADIVSFREQKIDDLSGKFLESKNEDTKKIVVMSGHDAGKNYLYGKYVQHSAWSKLYKRKLFDKLLFPKGMLAEDYATTYLFLSYANIVTYYDRKLYFYFIRRNSIMTKNCMKLTIDVFKTACKSYQFELEHFPEEKKIIETSYVNCLLKTIARIYNECDYEYEEIKKDIEQRLKKIKFDYLPLRSKIIYTIYVINKRVFSKVMYVMKKSG